MSPLFYCFNSLSLSLLLFSCCCDRLLERENPPQLAFKETYRGMLWWFGLNFREREIKKREFREERDPWLWWWERKVSGHNRRNSRKYTGKVVIAFFSLSLSLSLINRHIAVHWITSRLWIGPAPTQKIEKEAQVISLSLFCSICVVDQKPTLLHIKAKMGVLEATQRNQQAAATVAAVEERK